MPSFKQANRMSFGSATIQGVFSSGGGVIPSPAFSKIVTIPTITAFTVNSGNSGYTYILSSIGAVITLPSVASSAGCNWTFKMGAANGTTAWTITAPANTLRGSVHEGATTAGVTSLIMAGNAGTTVAFSTTALQGDWLNISSDGVSYYVSGLGGAAASFAVA